MTKDEAFLKALEGLNDEQRQAVETIDGPIVVLAGPGTGKTQIIALRIANILRNTDVFPSNILALTFTESGVRAMRERLTSIIGADAYDVCISTFHGFCNKIVTEFPEKFAFKKELSAIDEITTVEVIREIIDSRSFNYLVSPGSKYYNVKKIVSDITSLKQEGISVAEAKIFLKEQFKDLLQNEPGEGSKKGEIKEYNRKHKKLLTFEEFVIVYEEYQNYLKAKSLFDYSDMIRFVVERFKKDSDLLAHYQEQYLYIHADEFQDSNGLQIDLIKQLISSAIDDPNIFVVGDDDQSIYRFQGASIQNFSDFIEQFSQTKMITLKQNYRSTQLILDAARSVINNNEFRIDSNKHLLANSPNIDEQIVISHFSTEIEEKNYLVDEIKKLIDKGVVPAEIAVITRGNAELKSIASFLEVNSIKYSLAISNDVLENKYVRMIVSLLRVVNNPDNFQEFFKLLFLPYLSIDPVGIHKLSKLVKSSKYSSVFEINDIEDKDIINFATKIAESFKAFGLESFNNALLKTLNDIGIIEYLGLSIERIDDFNSLNNFLSFTRSLQSKKNDLSVDDVLKTIDSIIEHGLKVPEKTALDAKNSVQLMTAHKSKGLEFEYVFIPFASENRWRKMKKNSSLIPSEIVLKNTETDSMKDEESRRLFYVALTRAKKKILISCAINYDSLSSSCELVKYASEISPEFVTQVENEPLTQGELARIFSLKPSRDYKISIELEKIRYLVENNFVMSASAYNTYLRCKREFFLTRILSIPTVQTFYIIKGNILHELAEKYVGSGKIFNKEQIISDIARSSQVKLLNESEFNEISQNVLEVFMDWYAACKEKNELPVPLYKEFSFYNRQVFYDGVPINGKIDVIEKVGNESNFVKVVDYKTGSYKSKNALFQVKDGEFSDIYNQLLFYKLLIESDPTLKINASHGVVSFMSKNSSENYIAHEIAFNDEDYSSFKTNLKRVYNEILELKFLDFDLEHKCSECKFTFI